VSGSKPYLSERPRRKPDNAYRAVGDDGGLVVVPTRNQVKVLNPLGSRIFALLDGRHTRDEIVAIIAGEFEVTEEQARQDLDEYLRELEAEGMLAPDDESAPEGTP